jgi:hypothetical protein
MDQPKQPPDPSMPDPEDMGCGVKTIWETPLGDKFYPFCADHDKAWLAAYAGLNPNKSSLPDDWQLLKGMVSVAGWNPWLWVRAIGFFSLARIYGAVKWPKPKGRV